MSEDSLIVLLGDDVAGTLSRSRNGRLTFEYDSDHQRRVGATPLSLSMPVQVRAHSDSVVTPWLWGLLPDDDAVLSRWARRFQISASSPFAFLTTPVGLDCAGAVRFVRSDGLVEALSRRGRTRWLSDVEVGDRLRELRRDSTTWLGSDFAGRFSLAGAQAKTALVSDGARWGIPSGRSATTHILKPAITGLDDHDLNEHLCLRAGRLAGIPCVNTGVGQFDGESAIVVERYDRIVIRGRVVRVHQEDVCQSSSVMPSRKYQSDGGPGPADVADLFRRVMPSAIADGAVRCLADALIWNWIIAGTDAHAKNYSLLLSGPQVRLAPLYDIASALPYGTHPRKLRLAMKFGSGYELTSTRASTWVALAAQLRLDVGEVIERARLLVDAAPDAFSQAAREVRGLRSPMPKRLTDAVAERTRSCRRSVG